MALILDFDRTIKYKVVLTAGCHYDKVFLVKKSGVDYDWANVTEIIVLAKREKKLTTKILELKLTADDIEISTGRMIWHLPVDKTAIDPGDYNCFEVVLIFSNTKPKIWWSGSLEVLRMGTEIA